MLPSVTVCGHALVSSLDRLLSPLLKSPSQSVPHELPPTAASLTLCHGLMGASPTPVTTLRQRKVLCDSTNTSSNGVGEGEKSEEEFQVDHKEAACSLLSHFLKSDVISAQ